MFRPIFFRFNSITFIVLLGFVVLSRQLVAENIEQHPLDLINQALLAGNIREAEAALQKTYYLLGDSRYDEAQYGRDPTGPSGIYDCSATIISREIAVHRKRDKDLDPYGLLWKLWIDEADRILKQGETKELGQINEMPVRLLMPRGRLHQRAVRYRTIATHLMRIIADDSNLVSAWAETVLGNARIKPWPSDYLWPPSFLRGEAPYLGSYFDRHPPSNLAIAKKWDPFLEQFMDAVGLPIQRSKKFALDRPAWTWVLSDRVRQNTLVWDPRGATILFLSPLCIDRIVAQEWRRRDIWQQALREGVLHEVMLAFYLNSRPKSFMKDSMMDAVIQGATQSLLKRPGPLYSHGPFFTSAGKVALVDDYENRYLRYGTAPLWNYFYQLKGDDFLKKYLRNPKRPDKYLRKQLAKESAVGDQWLSFVAWVLSLKRTPEAMRSETPIASFDLQHPTDIELTPIDPPKGSIATTDNPVLPYSFRVFHVPIKSAKKIASMNIHWEPVVPQLSGYLFLVRGRRKEQGQFLDFSPITPGVTEEVIFDPNRPPTEAFLVVINRSKKSYQAEKLRLQVTVIPAYDLRR